MVHVKFEYGRKTIGEIMHGLEETGRDIIVDGGKRKINIEQMPSLRITL